MQFSCAGGIALIALLLRAESFGWALTVMCFAVSCVASSQETAADGYFLQALPNYSKQAFFVGVRSTFFRLGMLFMQGAFVWQVGRQLERGDSASKAWSESAFYLSCILLAIFILHLKFLPKTEADLAPILKKEKVSWAGMGDVFRGYFSRKEIWPLITYILFYRLGEAQLLRMESPFFLDPVAVGGLGLSTKAVGILVGTVGPFALSVGGIATGYYLSKRKLENCLVPMCIGMNVPNALFLLMSLSAGNLSHLQIACSVGIEQFFYGFGFASFIMVVIEASRGAHRTAYYSISAGIMAIGMMVPGGWSGALQQKVGYPAFFSIILLCTLPSLLVSFWAKRTLQANPR